MKSLNKFTVLVLFIFTKIIYAENENVSEQSRVFVYNTNVSSRQAGQIRFEDDSQFSSQYLDNSDHITFEGETGHSLKFEDSNKPVENPVTFQDDNRIKDMVKKKRKRKRKPRLQRPYPNVPGNLPLGQPSYPYPGFPGPQYPGVIPVGANPSGYYNRPPRRRKPSFASEALSTITGALTSIALYDDYQCVPRLLCEAAGGGALGSSSILQSVAGLQPLLTLLSAYGGVSSSPLFLFGRAVFLGMTSKGNTASCRYAYPQCPTDPEQLVHYLNNHNGGFFRFFNAPQPQNPQNLQQFYNQLSIPGQYPNPQMQNYGFYNPNSDYQNYGLYPQQNQYGFQNLNNGLQNPVPQNYGLYNPEHFNNQQSLYNQQYVNYGQNANLNSNGYGNLQNYGQKYPYQDKYRFNQLKFKDKRSSNNKIERRIQNKPNRVEESNVGSADSNVKWSFPDDIHIKNEETTDNVRGSKSLRFPEEYNEIYFENSNKIRIPETTRKRKAVFFPGIQSDKYVNLYNYIPISDNDIYRNEYHNINYENAISNQNKLINYYNNFEHYTNSNNFNNVNEDEEEGVRTVYIVRGNGDPNKPEIVKIRPGQIVQ